MSQSSDFRELLQKMLTNQASPAEVQHLFELFQTDPEAREHVSLLMKAEAEATIRQLEQGQLVPEATLLEWDPEVSRRMERRIVERIDAQSRQEASMVVHKPEPVFNQRMVVWRAAAVALLVCGIAFIGFRLGKNNPKPDVKYVTYKTDQHHTATLEMADGSVIRLNRNSNVQFPEDFATQRQRDVRLEGEAFFEVAKNPQRPFIIHTKQATIRVLGTAFNVRENQHDTTVIVAVREGRVAFETNIGAQSKGIVLTKGKVGTLHHASFRQTQNGDIANYLSWYNGRLLFRNTPLTEVVQQLTRIYDRPIQIKSPALDKLRFTANMKRDALPQVLDQLVLSLNIRYVQQGNTIILYKK